MIRPFGNGSKSLLTQLAILLSLIGGDAASQSGHLQMQHIWNRILRPLNHLEAMLHYMFLKGRSDEFGA